MKKFRTLFFAFLGSLFTVSPIHAQESGYTANYISLNHQSAVIYQPIEKSEKSSTAIVVMHSNQDYMDFIANKELSQRGYTVLATVPGGNTITSKMQNVRKCVEYLRKQPDIQKILLLGHSGGATIMTAYQLVAEQGASVLKDKLYPDNPEFLENLPQADGMILLDANWGLSTVMLNSIDPNVSSEEKGTGLKTKYRLEDTTVGYNPEGKSDYDEAFLKSYMRAQRDRFVRLVDKAQERLNVIEKGKGKFSDDEPFVVPAANSVRFYNKLYPQDTDLLSHTEAQWPLIHKDGSVTIETIRSVRAPMKALPGGTNLGDAQNTTVRGFLSTYAITVDEDYRITETGMEGIHWNSNINTPIGNVEGISIPLLCMGMTGSWEYLAAEHIYNHALSKDKSLAFVEGAGHMFNPDKGAEKYNGADYGNTVKLLFDYVDVWLTDRFVEPSLDIRVHAGEWTFHKNVKEKEATIDLEYYALEGIPYCAHPEGVNTQTLNIYVPAAYMNMTEKGAVLNVEGQFVKTSKNGRKVVYNAQTAPIIYFNTSGGYSSSKAFTPASGRPPQGYFYEYLKEGYVLVGINTRGKETTDSTGRYTGKAPVGLVDLKAGIRYLKHNDLHLAGDSRKIVSLGFSSGGAMSSLLGATGNSLHYTPYLKEIGAAQESDDVFIAVCYCPMTNLDIADTAFEWYQHGNSKYKRFSSQGGGLHEFSPFEKAMSDGLFHAYTDYIRQRGLDLGKDGRSGSFYTDFVALYEKGIEDMIARNNFTDEQRKTFLHQLDEKGEWLSWNNKERKATIRDFDTFMNRYMERKKACPSFDAFGYRSLEGALFSDEKGEKTHYSTSVMKVLESLQESYPKAKEYFQEYAREITPEITRRVGLMSPTQFIGTEEECTLAPYWRFRTGSEDGDQGVIAAYTLAKLLDREGVQTDSGIIWGLGHTAAEYSLDDLAQYIDNICLSSEKTF